MLSIIRQKIRALVEDFLTSDIEVFTYTNSSVFTLCESNVNSIQGVLLNGTELGSGEWSYDPDTNKIEIFVPMSSGDIVEVDFKFYKYSDSELNEYIRAGLVWISVEAHSSGDFELEDDDEIYPTPNNETTDLIALVSSILINPNYNLYRLPNLTVRYPKNFSKDEKISKLVQKFEHGLGVNCLISWD